MLIRTLNVDTLENDTIADLDTVTITCRDFSLQVMENEGGGFLLLTHGTKLSRGSMVIQPRSGNSFILNVEGNK